ATRSGKPDSRQGSLNIVRRQSLGIRKGCSARNRSNSSCSGPPTRLRKAAFVRSYGVSQPTICTLATSDAIFLPPKSYNYRRSCTAKLEFGPLGLRCVQVRSCRTELSSTGMSLLAKYSKYGHQGFRPFTIPSEAPWCD